MKKTIIGIIAVVLVVVAVGLVVRMTLMDAPPRVSRRVYQQSQPLAPAFDRLEFEMTYRGLTGEEDDLQYNSFWGFGGPSDANTPFMEAVRSRTTNVTPVYNPNFSEAEWAMVESEGTNVKALYMDLNADGALSDDEKIPPTREVENGDGVEFFTPDLTVKTQDGKEMKFRAMLQARSYGGDRLNFMWSPACVLEGHSDIDGQPVTFVLYANGFSGEFNRFGRDSYGLVSGKRATGPHSWRQTLSKVIYYNEQFYQLRLESDEATGQIVKAVIEKDTSPTGTLKVNLAAKSDTNARLNNATIKGKDDSGIVFNISGNQSVSILPEGAYVVGSGYIAYGPENENWNVSFREGPEIAIEPNKTAELEIGDPKMTIVAIDEKERYASEPTEKTVFSKGTTIYLSPKITGKAGEVYGRFYGYKNGRSVDLKIPAEIRDAEGKQILSKSLEYG